jgi:hypothetical protein
MVASAENTPTMTFAECGSLLLRLKRAIRCALASHDSWVEQSRIARRALSRLNGAGGAHLIVVRHAIGAAHAEARRRTREVNAVLREGGQHLLRIGDVIDRSTSFEERCDLLGANPAHRHELPANAGFAAIIVRGLEESARYGIDGGGRGPLLRVVWPLVVDAICAPRRELAGRAMRYRLRPIRSTVKVAPPQRVLH